VSVATLANPAAEGGTMGEKWPRILPKVATSSHFWVLLHAMKYDMGQTALLSRNISTIYIYNKTSIKRNILTIKKIDREVGRAKDLLAPLYGIW
jgi:hypothetical protein